MTILAKCPICGRWLQGIERVKQHTDRIHCIQIPSWEIKVYKTKEVTYR